MGGGSLGEISKVTKSHLTSLIINAQNFQALKSDTASSRALARTQFPAPVVGSPTPRREAHPLPVAAAGHISDAGQPSHSTVKAENLIDSCLASLTISSLRRLWEQPEEQLFLN